MTQEEKAKAYDEALETAKKLIVTSAAYDKFTIEKIFPELKESEDERIRKALIEYFNEQCDMSDWNGVYGYQVVAWLEKQSETKELSQSKVTKISDQDDVDALEQAMYALESFIVEDKPDKCFAGHHVPFIKAIEKLKSLKQRMQ